jgi:hypothetical protein
MCSEARGWDVPRAVYAAAAALVGRSHGVARVKVGGDRTYPVFALAPSAKERGMEGALEWGGSMVGPTAVGVRRRAGATVEAGAADSCVGDGWGERN